MNSMFFKNARIYRLSEVFSFSENGFDEALNEFKFKPCNGQMVASIGFDSPIEQVNKIAHHLEGLILIAVRKQEKLLPAGVINEEMRPRIAELERTNCRPLTRKEKQALKEETIQSMLPRAFGRSTLINAIIDRNNNLIIIDTASPNRAEDVLTLLRKALGSLPVVPCFDGNQLAQAMQHWVANKDLPKGLTLGHQAKFKAPDEDGAKATFENHLLSAIEVQGHLNDKLAIELELIKADVVSFRITETGTIKRIQWHELAVNTNDDLGWDDLILRLEADAILAQSVLVGLVKSFAEVAA